ncbi:hypothetical protein BUC_4738 [Burkholderia pseudomallei 576]|nr:hypothetical protein BUC_4738 [Burkholderia pseudomallei 576]
MAAHRKPTRAGFLFESELSESIGQPSRAVVVKIEFMIRWAKHSGR